MEFTHRRLATCRPHKSDTNTLIVQMVWYGMVWYDMVEVCEGAPVAVSGWVLTDGHDVSMVYDGALFR